MPTLVIERFAPPAGSRDARERAYCRERVAEELAERTVWCSTRLVSALEQLLAGRAVVREYAGGWASLLADIVGADREERVGGRRHVRPAVAVH